MNTPFERFSPDQFAALGVDRLAYVRPAIVDGCNVYTIHNADGNKIGMMAERDIAFAAVKQHDMEPVSVH
ncbi:MAG: hypothetical protein CL573_10105 [Alphaproteobacteria bacterium]|nr:hypothetical protein [Alphaproteobacteria bacterium]HCP00694.1 hypothetical protein [Rhodospirillaceae bacterium]|tara:strand:- start:219 stop:428 length:210 start_codon:yes stop_codon:yes gene_type:complete